jgi:Single-strand binding protein family
VLREIIEAALAPYYDTTLATRIRRAESEWRLQARDVIAEHVDPEALAEIALDVSNIEAETAERIEAIKTEITERVADANDQLEEMVEDIELPEAPDLPEVELAERPPGSVLVSSDWTWADQTRALKARKSYGKRRGRMSAVALLMGVLHKLPEQRASKAGKPFVMATLRVSDGSASEYWQLFAFAEPSQAELMRLKSGDRLSAQGRLQIELYTARDGQQKISRTLLIDHVLALRRPRRERQPPPDAGNLDDVWAGPPT